MDLKYLPSVFSCFFCTDHDCLQKSQTLPSVKQSSICL